MALTILTNANTRYTRENKSVSAVHEVINSIINGAPFFIYLFFIYLFFIFLQWPVGM